MLTDGFTIFYVDSLPKSAEFYRQLLQCSPVEASDAFAMFALGNGIKLGLWSVGSVEPAATLTGGGSEVALRVADNAQVDSYYQQWQAQQVTILQHPVMLDFGYTFVARDPDGHRLRVYAAAK